MELADVLSAAGGVIALCALLVATHANIISKRAMRVAQDPTTFRWECELDEAGFPTLVRNASATPAHRVRVTVVVDEQPQADLKVAHPVDAHGVVELDLKDVKTRYLATVQQAPLAFSSASPGPRLAAASVRFRVLVGCRTPSGAARQEEFEINVAHALQDGGVVREVHESTGRVIDPTAGVTRTEEQ